MIYRVSFAHRRYLVRAMKRLINYDSDFRARGCERLRRYLVLLRRLGGLAGGDRVDAERIDRRTDGRGVGTPHSRQTASHRYRYNGSVRGHAHRDPDRVIAQIVITRSFEWGRAQ
jgi:hypothetical protein